MGGGGKGRLKARQNLEKSDIPKRKNMSSSKIRKFFMGLDFAVRFQGGLFMFMFMFVSVTQNTCKGGPFLGA